MAKYITGACANVPQALFGHVRGLLLAHDMNPDISAREIRPILSGKFIVSSRSYLCFCKRGWGEYTRASALNLAPVVHVSRCVQMLPVGSGIAVLVRMWPWCEGRKEGRCEGTHPRASSKNSINWMSGSEDVCSSSLNVVAFCKQRETCKCVMVNTNDGMQKKLCLESLAIENPSDGMLQCRVRERKSVPGCAGQHANIKAKWTLSQLGQQSACTGHHRTHLAV